MLILLQLGECSMCSSSGSFSVCMVCHFSLSLSLSLSLPLSPHALQTHPQSIWLYTASETHLTSFIYNISNANGFTAALKLRTERKLSLCLFLLNHMLVKYNSGSLRSKHWYSCSIWRNYWKFWDGPESEHFWERLERAVVMLGPSTQDCSSAFSCFGCWNGRMVGFCTLAF